MTHKELVFAIKELVDTFTSYRKDDINEFIKLTTETYTPEQIASYLAISVSLLRELLPRYVNDKTKMLSVNRILDPSQPEQVVTVAKVSLADSEAAIEEIKDILRKVETFQRDQEKDLFEKVKRYIKKTNSDINVDVMFSNLRINSKSNEEGN